MRLKTQNKMQQVKIPKWNSNTFMPKVKARAPPNNKGRELSNPHQEVSRLNVLLNRKMEHCCRERNERMAISHELEETRRQLERQKSQKEFFMNRCKELERQQRQPSENTAATQGQNKRRKGNKRVADDEMQVDHTSINNKTSAELGGERESTLLKEELEKVKCALNELGLKYQNDMLSGGQQIETYQREMQKQFKAHADKVSHDQAVIKSLTEQQDSLRKNMAEESCKHQNMMQSAGQQVETLQRELQQQKQAHMDRDSQFQEYITSMTAEYNASCQKMADDNAVLLQKAQMFWTELEQIKTQLSVQNVIQKEYQELQALHKNCVEQFRAQIQEERNNTNLFKLNLERLGASYQELNHRYQSEVFTLQHQAKSKLCQFETETKSNSDKLTESQEVIQKLRAEQDSLQQNYQEKESFYVRQLEELDAQLNVQLQRTMELSEQLQADREDHMPPKRKRARREETPENEQRW